MYIVQQSLISFWFYKFFIDLQCRKIFHAFCMFDISMYNVLLYHSIGNLVCRRRGLNKDAVVETGWGRFGILAFFCRFAIFVAVQFIVGLVRGGDFEKLLITRLLLHWLCKSTQCSYNCIRVFLLFLLSEIDVFLKGLVDNKGSTDMLAIWPDWNLLKKLHMHVK